MLVCKKFSKNYGSGGDESFAALKNVSLEIKSGDCAAIVGKSGSGKSTLMHLFACLDTPTSGKIIFGAENVAEFSETERDKFRNETFGFVFQQFFRY